MNGFDNIKIVFIDIDGTLVNDDKVISSATRDSIKRIVDKGIYVVLVSGRDVFHSIDRSIDANATGIVISCNGAEIYNYAEDKVIFAQKILPSTVKKVYEYCENNEIGLLVKSLSKRYINKFLKDDEVESDHSEFLEDIENFENLSFSQIFFTSCEKEKVNMASKFAESLGLCITNFSESFIKKRDTDGIYRVDVNTRNISKGSAITYLLNYLKIGKNESLCFGDFINDVDMFRACGIKVAMGNAYDELKDKADYITKSNNDDGVAYFLNKYL